MPHDKKMEQRARNLGGVQRPLRAGGAELEAITGEPEPEIRQSERQEFLRRGFRRLLGAPKKTRIYGNPEEE
jgi:hypothetical protein